MERLKTFASVVAVMAAVASGAGAQPSADARQPPVVTPAVQKLAILMDSHAVVSTLQPRRSTTREVQASRPITGGQTVLPVIGRATTKDGVHWLRVMVPGRPNGMTGWIAQKGTELTTTRWRLVIRTSTRRLFAYYNGRLVRSFEGIVGKPSTPTPHGLFFVEESVRVPPRSAGAPFALALSARSNVLQEFDGGPGQIAIHGVGNVGGTPGTAVSHGCVRLDDRSIRWLVARIAPGVPVTITS